MSKDLIVDGAPSPERLAHQRMAEERASSLGHELRGWTITSTVSVTWCPHCLTLIIVDDSSHRFKSLHPDKTCAEVKALTPPPQSARDSYDEVHQQLGDMTHDWPDYQEEVLRRAWDVRARKRRQREIDRLLRASTERGASSPVTPRALIGYESVLYRLARLRRLQHVFQA